MATISTAVGLERKSRVSGFNTQKGVFTNVTPNLPQKIAVFGEANTANQAGLTTDAVEVTSAVEAGELFGYGSPIHSQMLILRSKNGGVGGIPTVVFPQLTNVSATASSQNWSVTGTATKNTTHYLIINGRNGIGFKKYAINIVVGDTDSAVAAKIVAAISNVLEAPVTAIFAGPLVTITTKWKGLTSRELDIVIDFGSDSAGLTYAKVGTTNGAGDVDLTASFEQFGDIWYTCVTNPYGTNKLSEFEVFNGVPDTLTPSGRYNGIIYKPFMAFFGSVKSTKTDLAAITNATERVNQCTNVLCPAPASKGFTWEAAANVVTLFARVMQDSPHSEVNGLYYPDMPIPLNGIIGDMSDYDNRDFLLQKGCSTVILDNGAYQIEDLVTTYHTEGEDPLQFSYCRNLNLDWNVAFKYRILENLRLKDKTLVKDNQVVSVTGTVKPKEFKAVVFDFLDLLAESALINEPEFSKANLQVQISATNPNRFETSFPYKRTAIARISSTTAIAGF